jgi:hypothetical protein
MPAAVVSWVQIAAGVAATVIERSTVLMSRGSGKWLST